MRTLVEWRKVKFLSQADLAAASGVTKTTINTIEHERRTPHPRTARKLAAGLGVEPGEVAWPMGKAGDEGNER